MEENPDLILTLRSITQRASDVFKLRHNQDSYVPPSAAEDTWSRQTTPATNIGDDESGDFDHKWQLTFNEGLGWLFGSSRSCDFLLGRAEDRISRRHFCIRFDDQGRLILEATSKTHTMIVSYNGRAEVQPRKHYFRWILFPWAEIKVIIGRKRKKERDERRDDETQELQFRIELAKHDSCQDEYDKRVQSFLEKSRNEELRNANDFSHLNMDSKETTAAPTRPLSPRPDQDPQDTQDAIYLPADELGRGRFAKVYKVIDVSTGHTYAGKYFYKSKLDERDAREIEIMREYFRVSHDHIVKFVDFTDEVGPLLVMEYVPGGNLRDQHRETPLTYMECIMILHQGLLGLAHLHNLPPNGIVHRDIKPENILLVSRYPLRMKYTDFGVATDSADLQTWCGTEIYAAPEIWTSSSHGPALDIWSLALVVFGFASGLLNPPDKFNYIEWFEQLTQVIRDCHSNDLINFLRTYMLKMDPRGRLSTGKCLEAAHGLFQAMLPTSDDETEVMTPTVEAGQNLEDPNLEEAESRMGYSTFTPGGDHQISTQIWIPPTDVGLPSTARGTPEVEPHRVAEGTSSQQERVSREQASTQILIGESLVQLPVKGKFVSMRKLDFWLNATQILVLAGKNEKQIKWTLGIMRKRTTVEVDMARTSAYHPTAWVCYGHGRFLCEALDLTDVLRQLLDYPSFKTITFEAQQAGQLNYLLGYMIFDTGKAKVELRKVDFWINATHIMYAAGRTRNAVTTLRKKIDHEIVHDYDWQGTYVDPREGLKLFEKYNLNPLTKWLKRIIEDNWQDWLGLPTEDSPDHAHSPVVQKRRRTSSQHRTTLKAEHKRKLKLDKVDCLEVVEVSVSERQAKLGEAAYGEEVYEGDGAGEVEFSYDTLLNRSSVAATTLEASNSLHVAHGNRSPLGDSFFSQSSSELGCVTYPSFWLQEDQIR